MLKELYCLALGTNYSWVCESHDTTWQLNVVKFNFSCLLASTREVVAGICNPFAWTPTLVSDKECKTKYARAGIFVLSSKHRPRARHGDCDHNVSPFTSLLPSVDGGTG